MKEYQGYFTRGMVLLFTLLALSQPVLAEPIELSMEGSIALALKNNPAIKIAEAGMGKAQWAVNEATASKGLNLSLTHTDSRYNYPPSLTGYDYYTYYTKFDNQIALRELFQKVVFWHWQRFYSSFTSIKKIISAAPCNIRSLRK